MSNASKYAVSSKLTVVTLFKQSFSKGFLAWLTSTKENASYICEGNSAYNIYTPHELLDMAYDDMENGDMTQEEHNELQGLIAFCADNDYQSVQIPL